MFEATRQISWVKFAARQLQVVVYTELSREFANCLFTVRKSESGFFKAWEAKRMDKRE